MLLLMPFASIHFLWPTHTLCTLISHPLLLLLLLPTRYMKLANTNCLEIIIEWYSWNFLLYLVTLPQLGVHQPTEILAALNQSDPTECCARESRPRWLYCTRIATQSTHGTLLRFHNMTPPHLHHPWGSGPPQQPMCVSIFAQPTS